MLAFVVVALANVFGQGSVVSQAESPGATLTVKAPDRLRGGLIFEGRFEIQAKARIRRPKLVLAPGWTEGMTLNTQIPQAKAETSNGGELTLVFEPIRAGERFTVWTQWQVNPVNVGRRPQDVTLYDGARKLTTVHRELTVFP
jgi:hypothetical protein